jgi:hypothetical protein
VVPSLALRNASASRSIGGALVVPAPVDVAASAASGGDSAVAAAAAAAAAQLAVMRALEPVHHRKMRQFTFSTASVVTFLPFPRRLVEERNRTHEPGVLDAWLDAVKREFHSGLNVTNETLGRPLRYGMCNCMKLVAQTTAAGPMLMSTMAAAAAVVKELPNLEHPSLHAALQQHSPVPSSAGDMLGVGAPLRRVYVFEFCKHDARDSLWCGYHSGNPRPRRRVGALGSTGGSGSETYGQLEAMTAGGADSAAVSGATTSGAADALPYVDLLHASHSSFAAQQRMMQQQQQQHEQHRLAAAELLRTLPVSTQQAQLQAQQRSAVASQSSSGPVLHSATDDHVRRIEQSLAHHPRLGDVVSRERGGQDARPVEARGGAGMAPDVGEGDIDDAVLNMHAAVAAAAAEGASASPRSSASSSSASSTSSSPPPPPPVVDGAREPDADRGDGSVAGRSMPAAKRVRAVRGASGALRAESALSAVARTLAQAERAIGGLANGALDAHSHDAVLRVESLASHLVQVLDGIAARCGEARARADELLSTVARLTAPPHSNGE